MKYSVFLIVLLSFISNILMGQDQDQSIEKINGTYHNEYGKIVLTLKSDSIAEIRIYGNEFIETAQDTLLSLSKLGRFEDTYLMNIRYFEEELNLYPAHKDWGMAFLAYRDNRLIPVNLSSIQSILPHLENFYRHSFYKIATKIKLEGQLTYGKGDVTLDGIYLKNRRDHNLDLTEDTIISIEGIVEKEKYPRSYYSTQEAPQGKFADDGKVHYRLYFKDYTIKKVIAED